MAEGSKVRLVRCPKCANLLPELSDYSVYTCGGCGALLRAKKRMAVNGSPGENIEDETKKLESLSEIEHETEKDSNGFFLGGRKDKIFKERNVNFVSNSLLRIQNKETSIHSHNIDVKEQIVGYDDIHRLPMNRGKGIGEIPGPFVGSAGSLRSKAIVGSLGFDHGSMQMADNRGKFSNFAYAGEGPSSSYSDLSSSSYGHDNQVNSFDDTDRLNRFAHSEQDRVELLRKLDELKEQICRTGYVVDKQRDKPAHFNAEFASPSAHHGHYSAALPPYVREVLHFKQFGDDMGRQKFHFPPNSGLNGLPVHLPRVNSHQSPGQYWQQTSPDYLHGEHIDLHQSYPQRRLYHQPDCACMHCYNKNWHVASIRPKNRSSQANSALRSRDAKPHYRWSSDIDSDMGTFHRIRQRKVAVARGNVKLCHPIAGGAPFITCCSCFELLKLPKMMEKNQHKLRCGSCLNVFSLEIKNKQLVISIPAENKIVLPKGDGGSKEDSAGLEGMKSSVDFDSADCDFQAIDSKGNILSEDKRLNLVKSEKRRGLASQSSAFSEDSNSLDSMIVQRNESNLTDQITVVLHKNTSQQNLTEKVSLETEVEASFDEYSTASLSQDSMEVSKEYQPTMNKSSESFLVGLMKRSFKDLSRSNRQMEPNLLVNGQPIPDHIVRKAEKLAGPIQPGDYWYDCKAGFWGVMGQPCLGIIPAFIKEFNYPMTTSCGGGNTGVFVNGRELNEKDLDLLASRGLPTTKQKSYIIEISGRVYDRQTGKELCNLGKLAPTVEKLKRGFGMKVPRKLRLMSNDVPES